MALDTDSFHDVGTRVCDTETCRWQIEQGSGVKTVHFIWLINKAYGLS